MQIGMHIWIVTLSLRNEDVSRTKGQSIATVVVAVSFSSLSLFSPLKVVYVRIGTYSNMFVNRYFPLSFKILPPTRS